MHSSHPSWSESLKKEVENPTPGGKGVQRLLEELKQKVARMQRWFRNPSLQQIEVTDDHARMVVAELLNEYKLKILSTNVTGKAVGRVLDEARNELRKNYREYQRRYNIPEEDWENSPAMSSLFFSPEAEPALEFLERLVAAEVIDETDYFFLLCRLKGGRLADAAHLVKVEISTVQMRLKGACDRIRAHLDEMNARISSDRLDPWTPPDSPKSGRPRLAIAPDILAEALKTVIEEW